MLSILSKEQRQKKSPLQRAAQAFDLAQSIASVGDSLSGLYKGASEAAGKGSINPEMFNPNRYKLKTSEILPEDYSAFRTRR